MAAGLKVLRLCFWDGSANNGNEYFWNYYLQACFFCSCLLMTSVMRTDGLFWASITEHNKTKRMDVQVLGGHDSEVKDNVLREYDTVWLGDWFLLFWTKQRVFIFMGLDVENTSQTSRPLTMKALCSFNPLAYTAGCETVWAIDVLLLILAFCQ
jgi:hypothetical protein